MRRCAAAVTLLRGLDWLWLWLRLGWGLETDPYPFWASILSLRRPAKKSLPPA